MLEKQRGCVAPARRRCQESLPAGGSRTFRLRPVRAVGCTGGTAGLDTNGPRGRKVVALTFDDGPSEYTPGFLEVLRDKHVHGTFFEIGQEMPGREATMRQILAEGNEIGDHTMHHVEYPGYSEIAGAAARIEAYTHFKPCLFRPPGGAVDSSVISTAGSLGMRTITWDVDPTDWSNPGTGASTAASSTPPSPARSSSCTTAAATAAGRWRRCRDHRHAARPRLPLRDGHPAARLPHDLPALRLSTRPARHRHPMQPIGPLT